jgi:hypothetical protein
MTPALELLRMMMIYRFTISVVSIRVASMGLQKVVGRKGTTAAELAAGRQRIIGPALAINVVLFIYVLFEPLLVTRISFIRRNEVVLAQMAYDLYGVDTLLFLVVFGFGIVAPSIKMAASVFCWYFVDARAAVQYGRWLALLGKLSMLDILLLAVLVVAIKGIGVGSVEIMPGLYIYVVLIVGSFLISLLSERSIDGFTDAGLSHTKSNSMQL